MTSFKPIFTALPLLSLILMAGCGPNLFTAATDVSGTGNWFVAGSYNTPVVGIRLYLFGGSLTNVSGQISGTFHAYTSCFANGATDIPYTGTLDETHQLSVTSSPVNGQVLSLSGTLSPDGSVLNSASFSVIGGCSGNIVSGTFNEGPGALAQTQATRVGSLTRTWVTAGESRPSFTENLVQSTTPDTHGNYALTGTVTVQGSPCFTQGTLQASSFVSGTLGYERLLMNDGSVIEGQLDLGVSVVDGGSSLTNPLPTNSLVFDAVVSGGQCNGSETITVR